MRTPSSGSEGFLAREVREAGGNDGGGISDGIGQLYFGRWLCRERGQALQDLFEGQVFATEDVAFAGRSSFSGEDVALGDIARIDQIQAGIDESGQTVGEKIDNDLAGGRGFPIVVADGSGRVDDDDWQTGAGLFESDLLGKPLGALVVASHIGDGDRAVFVAVLTLRHADTADGAGINDALDAGTFSGGEQIASAFDVGGVEIGRMLRPEAVIGGDMVDEPATLDGASEGIGIAEVASDPFDESSRISLAGLQSARTRWPCSARSRATCQPRKPLAPVTRVRHTGGP